MGTGEENTSAKPSKPVSSTPQEVHTTPPYPDWSNSMQAYYGPGSTPPPFFAPTVASPTPHPYLWGGQHPLIPPYGTPVPYPALYPSGGVYAHPNMATPPTAAAQANTELDGKRANGKDQTSAKKTKGPSGTKGTDGGKATSVSGNEGVSQSAESDSDGSSDASDENTNRQDAANKKGSFNQMLADASANVQASVPGNPVGAMPAANLNIGMDLWSASPATGAAKLRPNPPGGSSAPGPPTGSEQWIQDEREIKRQKRKQSNRESARRSRLRKQAECEGLQTRVENLSKDNHDLREELLRLSDECSKLKSENDSIKEELLRIYGPDAVADIEQNDPAPQIQSNGDKTKS